MLLASPDLLKQLTSPYVMIAETDHVIMRPIPNFATATRPAYEARGGLIGWRLGVLASHRLSPDWRLFGFGRLDHVGGAANTDSPLVSRQTGFSGGLGLQWTWMRSAQPAVD